MQKEFITQGKIIELTQEVLRGFYGRSINHLTDYMSDDFIWIGAFDYQYATSKVEFLKLIQSEMNAIPFYMDDEHYELITRDRDTFVLCCKFNLSSKLTDGSLLHTHTRLTVVWKRIDNALKLIHVHGSNAHDVPITSKMKSVHAEPDSEDFINYITSAAPKMSSPKKMFRLSTGEHCVLSESDILYLKADGQNTHIFTEKESFQVSGILQTYQKLLSDTFFRVHKSYLINTTYLTTLRRYQVTLNNEIALPVGREKYLSLKQMF